MGEIVYKRVFHPVGQGAFFTEKFYDKNGKALYSVVYDCGSKSYGIEKQMERTIRNSLHDINKINVLFLSHFDEDHVNYVMYLKTKGYLNGTRIFIPILAAEEWLEIEPYYQNFQLIMSLNERRKGGTKVIKVDFDEDEERPLENITSEETIEKIDKDVISSGTILKPDISSFGPIWRYTPFNVQFWMLINVFKAQLDLKGLKYDQLTDKDYVLKNFGKLKKIYQGLGKKPTSGTAINLNSLLVMSYPEDPELCKVYGNHTTCGTYFYEWFRWNEGITKFWLAFNNMYAGSCLYTGDTSANDQMVWKRIELMIAQCLKPKRKLTLLQVPHHGSKNSYDRNLVESAMFYAGFTNYDPYYKQQIFDDNLIMKFAMQKKPLILVTGDYESLFEEYWKLKI